MSSCDNCKFSEWCEDKSDDILWCVQKSERNIAYRQGRVDAIDEVIALARAEFDFESQAEQKRFVEFMEQMKEQNNG